MSDNRTRIWFSLFVLAIFGLGLATGLFMGRRMAPPPRLEGPPIMRGVSMPAQPPGMLLERLDRALRLSTEQRRQLEAIFKARGDRLAEVQREVVERADEERREMQAEIRTILTPEQQERFDRWLEEAPRGPGRGGGRGVGRGRGGLLPR